MVGKCILSLLIWADGFIITFMVLVNAVCVCMVHCSVT